MKEVFTVSLFAGGSPFISSARRIEQRFPGDVSTSDSFGVKPEEMLEDPTFASRHPSANVVLLFALPVINSPVSFHPLLSFLAVFILFVIIAAFEDQSAALRPQPAR